MLIGNTIFHLCIIIIFQIYRVGICPITFKTRYAKDILISNSLVCVLAADCTTTLICNVFSIQGEWRKISMQREKQGERLIQQLVGVIQCVDNNIVIIHGTYSTMLVFHIMILKGG